MGHTFEKIIMEENITTHPRRKAREVTMQALYALEINNGYPQDVLALCDDSFNNSDNDMYTRELFNCVVEKQSWADDLISQCLENWEYGRVAILDKILYFFFIKSLRFVLIFSVAFNVAAPFKSVVDDAALADVLGTLEVFVEDICTFSNGNPNVFATSWAIFVCVPCPISIPP